MTTPLDINQRRYALSLIPQDNYNTQTAFDDDENFIEFLVKDKNFVDDVPVTADNEEYSTGVDQATEQWIVGHEASVAKEFDICSEQIGRLLLAATGKVTTTQPDSVHAPTVYKHVFERLDVSVSRQLPALTLLEQLATSLDRGFPSCIAEALGIKGEGSQRLNGSLQLRGSGKKLEDTGVTIARGGNLHYFYESQVGFTLDDGSEVTNFADAPQRLNSWGFDIANELKVEEGHRPGAAALQDDDDPDSGEVLTECLVGKQKFNSTFNGRFVSGSQLHNAITRQKLFNAIYDILGAVIIRIPVLTTDTLDNTQGGDFNNTTNPVTVDKADYPHITPVVGDYYKIGTEYLKISVVASTTFTLVRAQFGTTNAVHADAVDIFKSNGTFTTYRHELKIDIAKMPFKSRKINERNGLVVLDIVANILWDVDDEKDVTITLWNTVPSYTA